MHGMQLTTSREEMDFEHENISDGTNRVKNVNSPGRTVPSHSVAIALTIQNAVVTGTFKFELFAEGSFDQRTWSRNDLSSLDVTVSGTPTVPHHEASIQIPVDYAYLRLRAEVTGGSAIFSAQIVFSDQ